MTAYTTVAAGIIAFGLTSFIAWNLREIATWKQVYVVPQDHRDQALTLRRELQRRGIACKLRLVTRSNEENGEFRQELLVDANKNEIQNAMTAISELRGRGLLA